MSSESSSPPKKRLFVEEISEDAVSFHRRIGNPIAVVIYSGWMLFSISVSVFAFFRLPLPYGINILLGLVFTGLFCRFLYLLVQSMRMQIIFTLNKSGFTWTFNTTETKHTTCVPLDRITAIQIIGQDRADRWQGINVLTDNGIPMKLHDLAPKEETAWIHAELVRVFARLRSNDPIESLNDDEFSESLSSKRIAVERGIGVVSVFYRDKARPLYAIVFGVVFMSVCVGVLFLFADCQGIKTDLKQRSINIEYFTMVGLLAAAVPFFMETFASFHSTIWVFRKKELEILDKWFVFATTKSIPRKSLCAIFVTDQRKLPAQSMVGDDNSGEIALIENIENENRPCSFVLVDDQNKKAAELNGLISWEAVRAAHILQDELEILYHD